MQQEIADTLAMMALIARTDEIGDCLIWQGSTTNGGYPTFKKPGGGCTLVRREVFRLCGGKLVCRHPIDTRCEERKCINPAHLFANTVSNIGKKAAKRGAWKTFARSAKIAAAKRSKGKLTMEQAREIRTSTESGPVLATRYGVHVSLINGIKRGTRWKDYSNPYAGLMAANEGRKWA